MDVGRRDVIINLSLVLLSTTLVLAGLEAVLRMGLLAPDLAQFKFCQGPLEKGVFHPVYGWTGHPNHVYLEKRTSTDDWSLYKLNGEGFRDTFNSGNQNVIVLGDSFTRGSLAGQNGTFPSLLDQWTPGTAFHNYGMANYGTAQELLVYRDVASRTPHSIVIVGYYLGNDLENNVQSSPERPEFTVQNGTPVLEAPPTRASGMITNIGSVLSHNLLTVELLKRRIPKLFATKSAGGSNDTGQTLQHQLTMTDALLREIADEANQHDAEVLILPIPERGEISPNEAAHRAATNTSQAYWNKQRDMIQQIATQRENVAVLDIKPALQQAAQNGAQVYGIRDAHLDDQGYLITAREIYRWLVSNEHINETNPNFSANTPGTTQCP